MSETRHNGRHLVTVWNPSYAADAIEQHLTLLLRLANDYGAGKLPDEQLYVWWGKVRSANRQGPQANLALIGEIGHELDGDARDEVQLYMTDYRSLYVGDVDRIVPGDLPGAESPHVPPYYGDAKLSCDVWFRLRDIRRLVSRDLEGVIGELRTLRNVLYNDRPVSLYGGMVDLPLIVTRPDGRRYFDEEERDAATEGKLWAEFDADHGTAVAQLQLELRQNLIGETAWARLEPEVRIFLGSAEKLFREHRDDPGFNFGQVVAAFAQALERQAHVVLAEGLRVIPQAARQAKVGDRTQDLAAFRPLTLGEMARVIGGEQTLNAALTSALEHGAWFTGSFPSILEGFATVRNEAVHGGCIDRATVAHWRERLLGVGCVGDFVELARVRPKGVRR